MAKVVTKMVVGGRSDSGIPAFADEIPINVLDEMLMTEADVIEPEIRRNAEALLHGKYWTGTTQAKLTRKKPHNWTGKRGNGQRQVALVFKGVRTERFWIDKSGARHYYKAKKPERNAAIAFVNEYGSRTTPPRPFIQTAIDKKQDEAYDSAEKVFRDWQKNNGM